jgi:hypothetical protein
MATHSLKSKKAKGAYIVALGNFKQVLEDYDIASSKPAVVILKDGTEIQIPLFRCDSALDVVANVIELSKKVGDKL